MQEHKILLIIPAYNEEKNILAVYNQYLCKKQMLDLIVINDGSTDNTRKVLEDNHIPHINLVQNVGIGGAVQTGYKYAYKNGYDVAVQFDGDGQHNIEFVEELVRTIFEEKADLVIGSRFIEKNERGFKSSFSRRIGIKIISGLIRLCTGIRITDPTSGFRAANKKTIKAFVEFYPVEYPEPDSIVSLLKKKFVVKEVSVVMNERTEGKSSIHSWKSLYYMINVCLSIILTSVSHRRENNDN